jgi:hypothetical protein
VNATHGVPAAQLRSARKPLQHLAPDQYVITGNMAGTPLDTHHLTFSITEQNLNRHTMVSNNYAIAFSQMIRSIAGSVSWT